MPDQELTDHARRIAELERKVAELHEQLRQSEPIDSDNDRGSSEPTSVAATDDAGVLELIRSGNQIRAVKLYREITGAGLAEAKDAVDGMAERLAERRRRRSDEARPPRGIRGRQA